ncbi:hypothetical protein CRUP_032462 [Coryphaenoides rupestris]|nr:hypothetical protein CRUP_032462 [Coryphaenoides rupestris]
MWDLTTAMEIKDVRALGGPTEEELLELLDHLYLQGSESSRVDRPLGGRVGPFCGSLPRQPPPPLPPTKPLPHEAEPSPLAQGHASHPRFQRGPTPQATGPTPPRRGSFVERCQELAGGAEGGRRSLAVCSELESRLGLRAAFSPSSSSQRRAGLPSSVSPTPSPFSSAPAVVSPIRSLGSSSPQNLIGSPDAIPSPEATPSPDASTNQSPVSGPPTSPKPPMNETSF